MRRFVKMLRDSVLVLSMSVGLLVVLELGLRVIFPPLDPLGPSVVYRPDDTYLVGLRPNFTTYFRRAPGIGGGVIEWSTNSAGFRGPELESSPGTRIVVYGDSNVQARFSELESTFPARLGYHLRELGIESAEVVNAGVIGFGPDQSLLRMKEEYDWLRPDIIVLHVFADNDFGDLVRNRLFEIDENGALVDASFQSRPMSFLAAELRYEARLRAAANKLRLVEAARRLIRTGNGTTFPPPVAASEILEELWAATRWEFAAYERRGRPVAMPFVDHYDIDVATSPDSESAAVKKQLFSGVLAAAASFADSVHVSLMVVIEPSVVDLTVNFDISYEDLATYPQYTPDALSSAMEDACTEHSIPCLNLFSTFSQEGPSELYFKRDNNHWNDAGQDLAASETARFLVRRLIPSDPTPERTPAAR